MNLKIARAEIKHALEVLKGANLHYVDAIPLFKSALRQANMYKLDKAMMKLQQARNAMISHS